MRAKHEKIHEAEEDEKVLFSSGYTDIAESSDEFPTCNVAAMRDSRVDLRASWYVDVLRRYNEAIAMDYLLFWEKLDEEVKDV